MSSVGQNKNFLSFPAICRICAFIQRAYAWCNYTPTPPKHRCPIANQQNAEHVVSTTSECFVVLSRRSTAICRDGEHDKTTHSCRYSRPSSQRVLTSFFLNTVLYTRPALVASKFYYTTSKSTRDPLKFYNSQTEYDMKMKLMSINFSRRIAQGSRSY